MRVQYSGALSAVYDPCRSEAQHPLIGIERMGSRATANQDDLSLDIRAIDGDAERAADMKQGWSVQDFWPAAQAKVGRLQNFNGFMFFGRRGRMISLTIPLPVAACYEHRGIGKEHS